MSTLTDLLDEIQDRADLAWDEGEHNITCPAVLDDVPRLVTALRAVLQEADALDELAASLIGAGADGALRLGARSIRHAITVALGVES